MAALGAVVLGGWLAWTGTIPLPVPLPPTLPLPVPPPSTNIPIPRPPRLPDIRIPRPAPAITGQKPCASALGCDTGGMRLRMQNVRNKSRRHVRLGPGFINEHQAPRCR